MKTIIDRSNKRGHSLYEWLDSYHSFSFGNYYNPEKMGFGALRVLNDDIIAPETGFDTHPHKNMEIVTIPLKGELKHGDSKMNERIISPGDIQVMSAGTGIYHSESNPHDSVNAEILQIWILPHTRNTEPNYNDYNIRELLKPNELTTLVALTAVPRAHFYSKHGSPWGHLMPDKTSAIHCTINRTVFMCSLLKVKHK